MGLNLSFMCFIGYIEFWLISFLMCLQLYLRYFLGVLEAVYFFIEKLLDFICHIDPCQNILLSFEWIAVFLCIDALY